MTRARIAIVAGACVATASALALTRSEMLSPLRSESAWSRPTDAPPPADPVVRVGALGRIEPCSEVIDIDTSMGDRIERIAVLEGQHVAAGDELVVLDGHDQAVAEREEVAALLEEARDRLTTTRAQGEAAIAAAAIELRTVQNLKPIQIESQKTKVRSLEAEAGNAAAEFARATQLLRANAITQEEFDRRKFENVRQQESLAGARLSLAEMEADFDCSLDAARAALDEARTVMEQSLAVIPVRSLERKLVLGDERVRRTIIRAPISGRVLKIRAHVGERLGNRPLMQLGDTSEMHAVAEVYETDIARVRVGQRASVSSASLGGSIAGAVVRVGSIIYKNDVLNVDPAADADARVVEVRIKLDEPERVADLTNLQVDVLIDTTTETTPDA